MIIAKAFTGAEALKDYCNQNKIGKEDIIEICQAIIPNVENVAGNVVCVFTMFWEARF